MIQKLPIAILLLCSVLPLFADSGSVQSAVHSLKGTVERVLDVVHEGDSAKLGKAAQRDEVRSVIESEYDMTIIIRRAIGRNWRLMEAAEQERVVELIKQLVVKSYLDSMNGTERPAVSYGEPIEVSDKRLELPSTIRSNGNTYHVVYRLGRLRSGWQIYDIVAENISIVSNYRQQFDDHFRRGDGEKLIEKLEALLQKETIDEGIEL